MPLRMPKHYALYMKIFTCPSVLLFTGSSRLVYRERFCSIPSTMLYIKIYGAISRGINSDFGFFTGRSKLDETVMF